MHKILLLSILALLSAPALAINKCEANGKISYSDAPCRNGKASKIEAESRSEPTSSDIANARQQAAREKNELNRLENERQQNEAREEKERHQLARANAGKQKKCADLALRRKWAEEDAAGASGKSAEKVRRTARRQAEKFDQECGQ